MASAWASICGTCSPSPFGDTRAPAPFLAYDPFGIKPLYYSDDDRTRRFASQVKTHVAGGVVSNEPKRRRHGGLFLWGYVSEPWTWLAAVKALPAGATLAVRRDRPMPQLLHYFDLREEITTWRRSRCTCARSGRRSAGCGGGLCRPPQGPRRVQSNARHTAQQVTAPSAADETCRAYLASTPVV